MPNARAMRRSPGEAPALAFRHLSKRFGRSLVLDDVSLEIMPGEVHGLLGQNGSGKSTLIKILAGVHDPEPGAELLMYGEGVDLPLTAAAARRRGIAFVHQNLSLIPSLSVMENLRIGVFGSRLRWLVSNRAERAAAERTFARFGLDIDPDSRIDSLSQADRALVAIVRAFEDIRTLSRRGQGVLVLDEPTPFLPKTGVERLFSLVRQIVADGASVILVSHDIAEIRAVTDRATVLRDGVVVGSLDSKATSAEEFVDAIVGERLSLFAPPMNDLREAPVVAEVRDLSGGQIDSVAFSIREGETLGLTGLMGSGFDDAPSLIYGARKARAGTLRIGGQQLPLAAMHPIAAMRAGVALLPADRLGEAGVGSLSIADNMSLPMLDAYARGLMIDWTSLFAQTDRLGRRYEVRPNLPKRSLASLSGGNQQKVLLAKWLQTGPKLLLLDEPTQGVDIGARQTIFAALHEATKKGTAILCASTDYEQLAQICDRVLVFAGGRIVRELWGRETTRERIAEACLNG